MYTKGQKVYFLPIDGTPVRAIVNGVTDGGNWANVRISAIMDKKWQYGHTFTTSTDQLKPRTR
jgi:hypothetical protein